MNNDTFKGVVIGSVVTLLVTLTITTVSQNSNIVDSKGLTKLNTITSIIEKNYYGDLDKEEVLNGIYSGALFNIDDYSCYLSNEDFNEFTTEEQRKFGVGIRYTYNKYTKVYKVDYIYDNSPASESDIKRNDIMMAIDDIDIYGMEMEEVHNLLVGNEGSKVKLTLLRDEETIDVDLVRRDVYFPYAFVEKLNEDTAYIKITSFTGTVVDDFKKAFEPYTNYNNLVIDLRGNLGGELDLMLEILKTLVPDCNVCTITYNNRTESVDIKSSATKDYNIVVLCNDATASCSEVFTGAIKGNNFGTIIGVDTFGKNEMQEIFKVDKDSFIKLTVGQITTPDGFNWHEVGISPDIELEYEYLGNDYEESNLLMDNQISKALDVFDK